MSDSQMVAAAQPELFGGCWAGRQESSRGGGRGGSTKGLAWETSGGRKNPPIMQGSKACGVGGVSVAGGGDKAFPRQINNRIIAAANSEDIVALLWVIKCNLTDMNLVNLSTSIHRLAKLAATEVQTQSLLRSNEVVIALLATIQSKLVQARVDSNLQQSLSNIAWSLATMQIDDAGVLVPVADLALKAIDGFKSYEVSTLVWAFAKLYGNKGLPVSAKRVFFAAANQSSKDLQSFSFRSLANIVWAYATGGVRHFRLFTNIAREMVRTAAESANCQGIANTIWAYSTAGHSDLGLFDVLTEAALPIVKDFKAQELSSMLWGLATSGFVKEAVFTAAFDAVRVMDLGPQQLANIVWACAKVLPNHAVTHAAVVELLPRVAGKFMAFKPQEVSSLMNALAKVASVEGEDVTILNGALILPSCVYQSIYTFLRFATPWFEEHLCNLSSMTFTSVVCVHEFFGLEQDGGLGHLVERQVIDRIDTLPRAEILQLLRALLSSRASSQAVCVLAGNLARNFPGLQPKEIRQLKQLSVAFRQPRWQFPPDEEKLYSWCLALAVQMPQLAQGSLSAALGDDDGGASAICNHKLAEGEAEGTPGSLELQDSLAAEADDDDNDSIPSLEPGDFYKECRLTSVDSLPNFPNTPEDSDDEYCKALFAQQANEVRSSNSSGAIANSNMGLGTLPDVSVDSAGIMAVALTQQYAFQM